MTEEVIELSVAETQALRAKLGLPPLRGVPAPSSSSSSSKNDENPSSAAPFAKDGGGGGGGEGKEVLSLSVDETNALRLKIGLPPLKTSGSEKKEGSSRSTAIHVKPPDASAEREAKVRIEDAAAKREAADRLRRLKEENAENEGGGGESAADFAARMLRGAGGSGGDGKAGVSKNGTAKNGGGAENKKKKRKKKKTLGKNPQLSLPGDDEEEESAYTSADLRGMKVSHAASDFAAGSTTVLTLADKSILDVDPDSNKVKGFSGDGEGEDNELVNVNMDNDAAASDNLKKKRRIELGAGRAGGYAGFDDDEFEETGGVGVTNAHGEFGGGGGAGRSSSKRGGFALGADGTARESKEDAARSDIFAGGAVSLQSRHGNKVASDFLSHDAEEEESKEARLERERAKQAKILEKLRKKDKKKAKKAKKRKGKRRSAESDDDKEDDGNEGAGGSLLASLEATAVARETKAEGRKRRRRGVDGDDDKMDVNDADEQEGENRDDAKEEEAMDEVAAKRKRFDQIMGKGKARTDRAFNKPSTAKSLAADDDEGEDDAFLNAALAKARRLKRLKELNGGKKSNDNSAEDGKKGGQAVVKAVEKMRQQEAEATNVPEGDAKENGGGITFEFDEMQEFTRALRAREDQAKRGAAERERGRGVKAAVPGAKEGATSRKAGKDVKKTRGADGNDAEGQVEDVDMQELAKEMDEEEDEAPNNNDDDGAAFGSTASSAPVGRGMSSFLSLLKSTGEIRDHATKEEMRGRAKDRRTYEDYEKLDLKKVVRINPTTLDSNSHAVEKDAEFANREIKLEYRDDHGRLLTRKEAYRDMCYQFHGHGSSKKNQERRLKQIEREREEARVTSNAMEGRGTTLGALRATQRATGKAFIIHKT